MILCTDAEVLTPIPKNVAKDNINLDVLRKIDIDLEIEEKLSLMFLIINDHTSAFTTVFDLFNKAKEKNCYILVEFITRYPEKWEDKLLEAICICNNRKIIKKLGINFKALETRYLPKVRMYSENLNLIKKCLYILCESLSNDEVSLLLKYVQNDKVKYDSRLKNINYLELYLLYWIEIKYISIFSTNRGNLKNLLKHLKRFDNLELIYTDLELCGNYEPELQVEKNTNSNTCKPYYNYKTEEARTNLNSTESSTELRKVKTGLCIIINEMVFTGQQYETRCGTETDCNKLHDTFKGFGFSIEIFPNLKKTEMLDKLRNIPKKFGTAYDCLFVCILSHGSKGSIIASDEKEVTLEEIEHSICSLDLKDVIKIVIIQACQGIVTGRMNDNLTTDGLSNSRNNIDITAYRNFGIFISTMQGFVSMRHTVHGSWFIQELCTVLQNEGNKTAFLNIVTKILKNVQNKRGTMDGLKLVAQLPELRVWRLDTDFILPKNCFSVQ